MTRAWLVVDAYRVDQATFDRLSGARDAFLHLGGFHVPVDARFVDAAIGRLVADGIPVDAITVGGR